MKFSEWLRKQEEENREEYKKQQEENKKILNSTNWISSKDIGSVPMSTSTRNKDADNRNFIGDVLGNLSGLGSATGIAEKYISDMKNNTEFQQKAKEMGFDLNTTYTPQENLNMFGADAGRTIESAWQGLKSTAANLGKGTLLFARDIGGASTLNDYLVNKLRNNDYDDLKKQAKEQGIDTVTLDEFIKNKDKLKTSYENVEGISEALGFNQAKREAEERIAQLQNETDSDFAKAAIGFMPNLSQQAVNVAAGVINPALVPYVAAGQAKGSYFDDAKQRGMTDEQANNFSTAMAGVEALTEKMTVKSLKGGIDKIGTVLKGGTKEATKEAIKETTKVTMKDAFKDLLKGMGENAAQEFSTELIQEAVADATTGKDIRQSLSDAFNQKDNWQGIWGRAFTAGIQGAISAGISGGAGMGIKSCKTVLQNKNATPQQLLSAYLDVVNEEKTSEQEAQLKKEMTQGAETAIQNVEKQQNLTENEQNITQNEQENIEPTQTPENAQIGENTEEQQITQQENENALKENVEPQIQEQTQENQAQEEKVQEKLTNEENEQKTQEKLTSEENLENDVQENLTSENENENVQENLTEEESRLSEEQKTEIKKLKDELKETRELTKKLMQINPSQAAELQKGLKGTSAEINARIREATQGDSLIPVKGGLTQKELTNKIDRLKSNYIGKEVTVDGKQGKITKNAFGKVGVQFEDGSEQFFLSKELTPVQDIDKIISEQQREQDIRDAKAKQQAQERLTNEIKEKVTKQYGEETANKVLEALNQENQSEEIQQEIEDETSEDNTPRQVAPNEAPKVVPQQDVAKERNITKNSALQQDSMKDVLSGKSVVETLEKIRKIDPKKRTQKQNVFVNTLMKVMDKGVAVENLSKRAKNRNLEAMWDTMMLSQAKAQYAIGNKRTNADGSQVDSLEDIRNKLINREQLEKQYGKGKKGQAQIDQIAAEIEQQFNDYMYHLLNTDRMSLVERGLATENKAVFGDDVTAEMSQERIAEIEKEHPEFKELAEDVYKYLDRDLQELVDAGVISEELKNRFKEMYPHYVPISRIQNKGNAISVPLDTKRTGINSPIKAAKGGSGEFQSLFETMGDRTQQIYRAADRNRFGLELRNTYDMLGELNSAQEGSSVETILDSIAEQNEQNGVQATDTLPTFTAFDNGNKVTFEISQDIYNSLKPRDQQGWMAKFDNSKASKVLRKISNFRRGILTEYNPVFALTNAIKDAQDVLYNSQHAMKTYKNFPEAYKQILTKGRYYQEYLENGGIQNSYYKDGEFVNDKQVPGLKKLVKMPFEGIAKTNEIIETAPRLAEYIASRDMGKSVQESMLDAARVTTNFKAGGDFTKFLNRNGATFLNASVQGLAQNVRNIREAHQKGIRGYATLLAKTVIAGTPALILNGLVWKDDEDYEELSDYVKDNYYIVGKVGDTFIRIPKGRVVAVVQDMVENVQNYMTGDKEIDGEKVAKDLFGTLNLAGSNLAPNNPLENNVLSPIKNVMENKTWYGEDLVSKRLQNKPDSEQYDEKTDEFSKWLGQVTGWSPVKINYLLDQYGGMISDIVLPGLTPQADSNNVLEDKFTVNATMKNKNPSEFYSMKDELEKAKNSSNATDTDKLKYQYYNKVYDELSDLNEMKRNIQMSDNTDEYKKESIKDIQKKINEMTKNAVQTLENYDKSSSSTTTSKTTSKTTSSINTSDDVSTIGDYTYYKNEDGDLKRVSDTDSKKNNRIGLSNETYARFKSETSGISDTKEKEEILLKGKYTDSEKQAIYNTYISKNDKIFEVMSNLDDFDVDGYLEYKTSYNGTTKDDLYDYMDEADMPYIQKLYITGTKHKLTAAERNTLADYIDNLDISLDDKIDMFRKLKGATVTSDGQLYY